MPLPIFVSSLVNEYDIKGSGVPATILTSSFYSSTAALNDYRWLNQSNPQYAASIAAGWTLMTTTPDATAYPIQDDGYIHPVAGGVYDPNIFLASRTRIVSVNAGAAATQSTPTPPGLPLGF